MKKWIILLAVATFSCGDDTSQEVDLKLYEDASISSTYPFVESGNNLVFHYYYKADDKAEIADDEFSEDFFFEIIPDGNSFELSTEDLIQFNLPILYRHYCFCVPVDQAAVKTFSLNGTKNNSGNWKITGSFDLTLSDSENESYSYDRSLDVSGSYKSTAIPSN